LFGLYDTKDDDNDDGTSFAAPFVTAAAALLWSDMSMRDPGRLAGRRLARATVGRNLGDEDYFVRG
jgi:hypothetical protein